jgi:arginine repressor
MITGFEEYTIDVQESELRTVNLIAKSISLRVGEENAITNSEIRKKLLERDIEVSDAKIRKFIQYIRVNKLCTMLCASKKGYYTASSEEDWIKYRESFRERVRSMQFTLACMG